MNNTITLDALNLLAEGTAAPSGAGSLLGSPFFMIFIMFAFMYFLIIRPQSKQKKEQAARIAALKKGDQVITAGGIHGSVHHISDKTVTLKLSEGVFVPFEKPSITSVTKASKGKKSDEVIEVESSTESSK